jgi:hypothetical protein
MQPILFKDRKFLHEKETKVCKEKGETPKNTPKPTISAHRFRQTRVHLQSVIKRFFHPIYLRLELG